MAEKDSTWKEALERYLEPFLALFFPAIHADIDWTRGHEWLDKELHKMLHKDEIGERVVDVLVKVWRKDGKERWLLIHIEVQGSYEAGFTRRMFVYHYRLFNRYNRDVCSLAILADERESWRPKRYSHAIWGCRVYFKFPMIKLLELRPRLPELEASRNPFAILVAAYLRAQETGNDATQRRIHRIRLYRGLCERRLSREDIETLFHLIDGFMILPPEEDELFWQEIELYQKEHNMPHMTSIERRGMERGRAEGRTEGRAEGRAEMVLRALERRCGVPVPEELAARIRGTTDLTLLDQWFDWTYEVASLDEFHQRMQG